MKTKTRKGDNVEVSYAKSPLTRLQESLLMDRVHEMVDRHSHSPKYGRGQLRETGHEPVGVRSARAAIQAYEKKLEGLEAALSAQLRKLAVEARSAVAFATCPGDAQAAVERVEARAEAAEQEFLKKVSKL